MELRSARAGEAVIRGRDGLDGGWRAGTLAVAGLLLSLAVGGRFGAGAVLGLCAATLALAGIAWRGAGFRLLVSPRGLTLLRTVWGLPVSWARLPLDARLDRYQAWEDDVPEAVALEPPTPRWGPYPDAVLFGPYSGGTDASKEPAIDALFERVQSAITAARAAAPAREPGWRGDGLSLDEAEIVTRRADGRVTEARLLRARTVLGHALPVGTRLVCNADLPAWAAPERPDHVSEIGSPQPLPLPGGLLAAPGALVSVDTRGRPRRAEALVAPARIGPWTLDPARPVELDERGRPCAGALAEACQVGPLALRPGDELEQGPLGTSLRLGSDRLAGGRLLPRGTSVSVEPRGPRLRWVLTHEPGAGPLAWTGQRWVASR